MGRGLWHLGFSSWSCLFPFHRPYESVELAFYVAYFPNCLLETCQTSSEHLLCLSRGPIKLRSPILIVLELLYKLESLRDK